MSLRAEAAASRKRTGPVSNINRLLTNLNGDARDDVIGLIWDDTHISSSVVAATLDRHYPDFGPFSDQQVRNHRNGPRP